MIQLEESRGLSIYKSLLNTMGDFQMNSPLSGIMKHLDIALEQGKKILPKDELALEIIDYCLSFQNPAESIQFLLNRRISDLPPQLLPFYKSGNRKLVACWKKDDVVYDRIKDLLNFDGDKSGKWVDLEGNTVELLSTK